MDHIATGNKYYESGHYEKAIAEYSQAIKLDPTNADAYRGRGITYGNLGQYEKASGV